jgi:hypothetical protein
VKAIGSTLALTSIVALAGCSGLKALGHDLTSLHNMSVPRHYLSAGGGAGVSTDGDFAGDAVVQYHYTPRVLYRTGLSARSTLHVLDVGPDLELDPLKFPVRLTANGGYSVGYSSADTWYLGAGLRWELLRSAHPFATNAEPQQGLSLAASYETRFGGQSDVIWLSLLLHYVPGRPE